MKYAFIEQHKRSAAYDGSVPCSRFRRQVVTSRANGRKVHECETTLFFCARYKRLMLTAAALTVGRAFMPIFEPEVFALVPTGLLF